MKNKIKSIIMVSIIVLAVLAPGLADPVANQEEGRNKNQIKIENKEQNKTVVKNQNILNKLAKKIKLQQRTKMQLKQMDKLQLKDGSGTGEKIRAKARAGNYRGKSTK